MVSEARENERGACLGLIFVPTFRKLLKAKRQGAGRSTISNRHVSLAPLPTSPLRVLPKFLLSCPGWRSDPSAAAASNLAGWETPNRRPADPELIYFRWIPGWGNSCRCPPNQWHLRRDGSTPHSLPVTSAARIIELAHLDIILLVIRVHLVNNSLKPYALPLLQDRP